jgi:hypothetical protein
VEWSGVEWSGAVLRGGQSTSALHNQQQLHTPRESH